MSTPYSEIVKSFKTQNIKKGFRFTIKELLVVIPAGIGHVLDGLFRTYGLFGDQRDNPMHGLFGFILGIVPTIVGLIVGQILQIIFNIPSYFGFYLIDHPISFLLNLNIPEMRKRPFTRWMVERFTPIFGLFTFIVASPPTQLQGPFGFLFGFIPEIIRRETGNILAYTVGFVTKLFGWGFDATEWLSSFCVPGPKAPQEEPKTSETIVGNIPGFEQLLIETAQGRIDLGLWFTKFENKEGESLDGEPLNIEEADENAVARAARRPLLIHKLHEDKKSEFQTHFACMQDGFQNGNLQAKVFFQICGIDDPLAARCNDDNYLTLQKTAYDRFNAAKEALKEEGNRQAYLQTKETGHYNPVSSVRSSSPNAKPTKGMKMRRAKPTTASAEQSSSAAGVYTSPPRKQPSAEDIGHAGGYHPIVGGRSRPRRVKIKRGDQERRPSQTHHTPGSGSGH